MQHDSSKSNLAKVAVAAIGVVYGDIGTSPLYTIKEVFGGHGISPDNSTVLGILSLIFWSLLIVVSLKYVVFIMRADNKGEGGIMALMALVQRATQNAPRLSGLLMLLGIFGASLFFGDAIITPAISVLSAVEGLEVGTPLLHPYIIPIAIGVLSFLFFIQRKGTASVGAMFGPVMLTWFGVLGFLGALEIMRYPDILGALNPVYALHFFSNYQWHAFIAMGAVVLAVTGAEALYADMGHFGKRPVQFAWFFYVLPALLLNYFGQGALLIHEPEAIKNPFYLLAPDWALYPMIALSTLATIIASQAVITGAFSVTRQAIQLGYLPRMEILHTSAREIGQIYIPIMNWGMLLGIVGLILLFQSSTNLAAAYGIAVTGTMAIDTILAFVVFNRLWGLPVMAAIGGASFFLVFDFVYFSANAIKIPHGGWMPLMIGVGWFTLMTTWKRGKQIMAARQKDRSIALDPFLQGIAAHPPQRVSGTAVFLTTNREGVPHALMHNLLHNKVLHERIVLLTVTTADEPWIPDAERAEVIPLENGFYRVVVRYGFKDEPDIPAVLTRLNIGGEPVNMMETSFYLSRETLIPSKNPEMAYWRETLFVHMAKNGSSATAFFKIPTNRVLELGTQIEL